MGNRSFRPGYLDPGFRRAPPYLKRACFSLWLIERGANSTFLILCLVNILVIIIRLVSPTICKNYESFLGLSPAIRSIKNIKSKLNWVFLIGPIDQLICFILGSKRKASFENVSCVEKARYCFVDRELKLTLRCVQCLSYSHVFDLRKS